MTYSIVYLEYLKSDAWRERRASKLEASKFRCERCGEREGLEVHHLSYDRLGQERTDDLIVLCKSHHWVADELRRGNDIDFDVEVGATLPDKFVGTCPRCGTELVKSSYYAQNGSMFCPKCRETVAFKSTRTRYP